MRRKAFRELQGDADTKAGCGLMQQLRLHWEDVIWFTQRTDRQSRHRYPLLGLWQGHRLAGLIEFRESENLLHGHYLYVGDLVVDTS